MERSTSDLEATMPSRQQLQFSFVQKKMIITDIVERPKKDGELTLPISKSIHYFRSWKKKKNIT